MTARINSISTGVAMTSNFFLNNVLTYRDRRLKGWRALWGLGARDQTPFLHHWVNVLLHGANGALEADHVV
jgi:putative flippase GtrA